jgi:NAD(P)-dependent dehydrogenase (short-subunit alcohol dehydrogenase family)
MSQEPLPSGERGWIVNIASVGGFVDLALEPSYCPSKGAVVNLTRQVAVDYAPHKIHVNAVCAGFLATAMVRPFLDKKETNQMLHAQSPWLHLGTPEDVAKAVLLLASPAAS